MIDNEAERNVIYCQRYQNGKPKKREDFHAETVDGMEIRAEHELRMGTHFS